MDVVLGLVTGREDSGRPCDKFRDRLIFPIHEHGLILINTGLTQYCLLIRSPLDVCRVTVPVTMFSYALRHC